jgi:hypothetical protein
MALWTELSNSRASARTRSMCILTHLSDTLLMTCVDAKLSVDNKLEDALKAMTAANAVLKGIEREIIAYEAHMYPVPEPAPLDVIMDEGDSTSVSAVADDFRPVNDPCAVPAHGLVF